MKTIRVVWLFILFLSTLNFEVLGQSRLNRAFIKENIEKWGGCKNVAITATNGDLAFYGKNAWASTGPTPKGLTDALDDLYEKDELIDDVVLTENGYWIVLYGNNGFRYDDDIPSDLYAEMRRYNKDDEVITSITLNDNGDWIIISEKHFTASNPNITEWLKEGMERHGGIWAAHITNDAMVAVFEKGYKYFGKVPEDLKDALEKTNINVYRLKFTPEGSYFFADRKGRYAYSM